MSAKVCAAELKDKKARTRSCLLLSWKTSQPCRTTSSCCATIGNQYGLAAMQVMERKKACVALVEQDSTNTLTQTSQCTNFEHPAQLDELSGCEAGRKRNKRTQLCIKIHVQDAATENTASLRCCCLHIRRAFRTCKEVGNATG